MSAIDRIRKKRNQLAAQNGKMTQLEASKQNIAAHRQELSETGKIDYGVNLSPVKSSSKKKAKKDEENGLWSGLKYLGKELGIEAFGGVSKIPYALTSEVGANLTKGEDEKFGEKLLDTWKSVATLSNPAMAIGNLGKNVIENAKDQEKTDKSTVNKILGTAFNTVTEDNAIDKALQTAGTVLPDGTGETINKGGEKILSPYLKAREKLNVEKAKQSGAVQFGGDVIGVIGNMAPAIAATVITKNPNVGRVMIGASAKGGATNEALQGGADLETATKYGLKDGDIVDIVTQGERSLTLHNVLVRAGEAHADEVHIDTDEANACNLDSDMMVDVVFNK